MIRTISHIILKKIIQAESRRNPNRAVLWFALELGFPIERVRMSLFELNGIRVTGLGTDDVSVSTIYNVIKGSRRHGKVAKKAKTLLAEKLELNADEVFPAD
jgi:hypothetical protein